jgi:Zn-dependent protease/predicted transcriptional regulator
MKSNIRLGKVAGIEIGLHYSWFIIAALIAFSLGQRFHQANPGWGTWQVWVAALLTAVLFFVTLLLHELAHSLVAQARGLKVKSITLFALGGVSQIEGDSPDSKTEFWVAIAGPLTSQVIGFSCLGIAAGLGWHPLTEPHTAVTAVLVWLGYINVVLGVFNLIPGFPLDGGRVFRAIVWAITKDADRSTRIAARVGQVVAFLFIVYGIWSFFNGAGFNGLWMAFIGWFLMDAAQSSYAQVEVTAAFRGMRVSEVMSRDCATVDRGMSLQEFVDSYVLRTGERCFAVEDRGRFVGLITLRDVGAIPRDRWQSTTVREAMRPLEQLHVITPDTQVLEALKLMTSNDVNQLPVVANGALQGVVCRSHLMQLLQARSELQASGADYPPLHRMKQKGVTP